MRTLRTGCAAFAVSAALAALPAGAQAKSCPSGQFARGAICTKFTTAARQILWIARSTMSGQGGKAAILRIQVGGRTVINRALGDSMAGVPATPAMHFRIGSMALPLLTTLALQLQDEKRLNLDDKLSRWYPNLKNASRVTLRMLASATSGYPDYLQLNQPFQDAWLSDVFRYWSEDQLLDYAFAAPIACDPGKCFRYSHTGFILLGRVLSKITGESVPTMVTRRFIRPLGLRNTRITKLPFITQPVLHAYDIERKVYEESTYWNPSLGPALIMTSNAGDLTKVMEAVGTGRFVSRSAQRQLVQPLSHGLTDAPPKVDYGLGMLLAEGWMFQNPEFNGYHGVLGYLPAQRISVLVVNTFGPRGNPNKSISTAIFGKLTQYLSPRHAIHF